MKFGSPPYPRCFPFIIYNLEFFPSLFPNFSHNHQGIDMSTKTRMKRQFLKLFVITPRRTVKYILSAVTRIFKPNDDKYPATGMQPFEGDPPKQKYY